MVGEPTHAPVVVVSTFPSTALPAVVGSEVFVGAMKPEGMVTTIVPVADGALPGCWKLVVETVAVSEYEFGASVFGTVSA